MQPAAYRVPFDNIKRPSWGKILLLVSGHFLQAGAHSEVVTAALMMLRATEGADYITSQYCRARQMRYLCDGVCLPYDVDTANNNNVDKNMRRHKGQKKRDAHSAGSYSIYVYILFFVLQWHLNLMNCKMHVLIFTTDGCRSGSPVKASLSLFLIREYSSRTVLCSISATSTFPCSKRPHITSNTKSLKGDKWGLSLG